MRARGHVVAFAEEFLARFGTSPWGPMALAFLFGVAFGWVVWGARPDPGEDADRMPGDAVLSGEAAKEIVVIKAEIAAARELLDDKEEGDGEIAEQLSSLDEAVKRANGRLKVIIAALKRVAVRD
jgi:hypothetical protein